MPKSESPEALVRDALARAGRTDARLLKRCLAETKGRRSGLTPRGMAVWALKMQGLRLAEGDGPIEILQSGRDPEATRKLAVIAEEEVRIKERLTSLGGERDRMMNEVVAERLDKDGRAHGEIIVAQEHDCDGSPVGHCAYDTEADGALDICLFCGLPDERK